MAIAKKFLSIELKVTKERPSSPCIFWIFCLFIHQSEFSHFFQIPIQKILFPTLCPSVGDTLGNILCWNSFTFLLLFPLLLLCSSFLLPKHCSSKSWLTPNSLLALLQSMIVSFGYTITFFCGSLIMMFLLFSDYMFEDRIRRAGTEKLLLI